MRRVLITGASGFIGSRLCRDLVLSGDEVVGLVRKQGNGAVESCLEYNNFSLIEGGLSDLMSWGESVDMIVHAAARSPYSGVNFSDYIESNVVGVQRLLEFAYKGRVSKIVFLSSMSVYGSITVPEVTERTSISDPEPYGLSKYFGEQLFKEKKETIPTLVLRLPAVLGPRANNHPWPRRVVTKLLNNETVSIYSPESLFNNIVSLGGVVRFVRKALDLEWSGYEVVNLGSSSPLSVKECVNTMREASESCSEIVVQQKVDAPFLISTKKAEEFFGFESDGTRNILFQYVKELKLSKKALNIASSFDKAVL